MDKNIKRLAVIPSERLEVYLSAGFTEQWLTDYFNPGKYFDEVYLLSPIERNKNNFLGMRVINTEPNKLREKLKKLKIDIVRAYGGYWACNMACNNKASNIPVVVSIHDSRLSRLYDSICKADIVFCMSNVVKEMVHKKYHFKENIWILPNRVDFDVMHPYQKNETLDLDMKYKFKFKIIHVGRKVEDKNLDTVIKALKILGEDYCLIAIGDGNAQEYIKLAENENVCERAFFLKGMNHFELSRYYSWADCLCNPSRTEGFGMIFIEALACKNIVITSDKPPMNEYIENFKNGILVKNYEDPTVLSEAIKLACGNQKLREIIKNNSRKSIEKFKKQTIDDLEVSYYKKILKLKLSNNFVIPYHKRITFSIERNLKEILPDEIKAKIRVFAKNRRDGRNYEKVN